MHGILDTIHVEGFKSLRDLNLKLSKLNVLIGPNGVGKSNFIALFRLLNQIIERRLQVHVTASGGADTFLYFGRKHTKEIAITLTFSDRVNGYTCKLQATDDDNLFFTEETDWFHDKSRYKTPYTEVLGTGHRETNLIDERGKNRTRIADWVIKAMRSWRIYHFHDTTPEAKVKQPSDIHDNRVLRGDASNLAAFLFMLREKHEEHYANIVDAVRMVAPFFDDFVLEPLKLNPDKIRLEWKEKASDVTFGPMALSDGTQRFICLATLLLQPHLPSTILLDEPELGLHPYAIVLLADLLRGAATRTQVIASTQSVTLVNQFEPDDVLVVDREDRQSVFKHLGKDSMNEWLEDYGLGDLWEKNLLGGRP